MLESARRRYFHRRLEDSFPCFTSYNVWLLTDSIGADSTPYKQGTCEWKLLLKVHTFTTRTVRERRKILNERRSGRHMASSAPPPCSVSSVSLFQYYSVLFAELSSALFQQNANLAQGPVFHYFYIWIFLEEAIPIVNRNRLGDSKR